MYSPLSYPPAYTPGYIIDGSLVLALAVFPFLFFAVSIFMWFARVPRPPYFAYFCAFASLGTICLCIATGNTPISVLAGSIGFFLGPLLMVRNVLVLGSRGETSIHHRTAWRVSLFSLATIVLLLVWTMFDGYTPPIRP